MWPTPIRAEESKGLTLFSRLAHIKVYQVITSDLVTLADLSNEEDV